MFQQPWAQQILNDLVITINAYFASEISWHDWTQAEGKDRQMYVLEESYVCGFLNKEF